jgi:hypothetical protein
MSLVRNLYWLMVRRPELEALVEEAMERKIRPAMRDAYDGGFSAGVAWALDDLLRVPVIEDVPELEVWIRDARAFVGEHWNLERP